MIKVLVVDDDIYLLTAMQQTLSMQGYEVEACDKPVEALALVAGADCWAAVVDVKMPRMDGLQFLERVMAIDRELPVIMLTGHGDVAMAVTAMKKGAYDFLEKPVDEDVLLAAIARGVEKRRLVLENRTLARRLQLEREGSGGFHGLIGRHPAMHRLFGAIEAVAEEEDPVFISGETGTGKELVARAIHELSGRRDQPFVAVNMGAIPMDMLESELFGYNRGAFTGAVQSRMGRFEYAGAGTLFLDEICSLPVTLQAKLLRVLEEKAVIRLGSNVAVPVAARIIAATNKELGAEIGKGAFRQDLYFRLNVLPVEVPALRDRKSDIPILADHFREEYCRDRKQHVPAFDQSVIDRLLKSNWPGNVRELRNYVRRLCVYSSLPEAPAAASGEPAPQGQAPEQSLKEYMEGMERRYIVEMLEKHEGRLVDAHRAMGISRKCLYDKLSKHGLAPDAFRPVARRAGDGQ